MREEVTDKIEGDESAMDGESLPLARCICGKTFGWWEFVIHPESHGAGPKLTPCCGRKFYYEMAIKIFEIK